MSERSTEVISTPEFYKSHVSIDIWFSPHFAERDYEGLEDLLRRGGYDIYIPELVGRTPQTEDLYRKIATGNSKTYQDCMNRISNDHVLTLFLQSLYASRVNLLFVDATQEQLDSDENLQLLNRPTHTGEFISLDDVIREISTQAEEGSRGYLTRDTNIVNNVEAYLGPFISDHPKLKNKEELRLLLTIGGNHVLLPGLLSEAGYEVQIIRESTTASPIKEVQIRTLMEQPIGRDLLIKAAAEAMLSPFMYHPSTERLNDIVREITNALPEAAVEGLLEGKQRGGEVWVHKFIEAWLDRLKKSDSELRLVSAESFIGRISLI